LFCHGTIQSHRRQRADRFSFPVFVKRFVFFDHRIPISRIRGSQPVAGLLLELLHVARYRFSRVWPWLIKAFLLLGKQHREPCQCSRDIGIQSSWSGHNHPPKFQRSISRRRDRINFDVYAFSTACLCAEASRSMMLKFVNRCSGRKLFHKRSAELRPARLDNG